MEAINDSNIICPKCGNELRPTAETCRACDAPVARPQASESKESLKQLLDRPWVILVLMLHVGLLGIPVYWMTKYSIGVRLMIVIASVIYTLGAVTAIVVMLQWLFHMLTGA